jgi:hypothetical protein
LEKFEAETGGAIAAADADAGTPQRLSELVGPRISAAAGVVIAKSHAPLATAIDLGRQLCRSAKQRCHRGREQELSALDFHVVSTPAWRALEAIRGRDYTTGGGSRRATARPYTTEEMRALMVAARTMRDADVPTGKLLRLYAALWEGDLAARFAFADLFVHARTSQRDQRGALMTAAQQLGVDLALAPWRKSAAVGVMESPWGDLIEVIDFVNGASETTT